MYTEPIEVGIRVLNPVPLDFWTGWSDPVGEAAAVDAGGAANAVVSFDLDGDILSWRDPLRIVPLTDRDLDYGLPRYTPENPGVGSVPFSRNLYCLPLASVFSRQEDRGISLIQDPRSMAFDVTLHARQEGAVSFEEYYHRLGQGIRLELTYYIQPHGKDFRGGLSFLYSEFPQFFDPACPQAHHIAGGGAYSTKAEDIDVEKLRAMGFRVNWKASFDFPYMGMFLPDTESDEAEWVNFRGERTSIAKLRVYSEAMRRYGFHVLNYFNVTEFGAHVEYPFPDREKGGCRILKEKLSDAVVLVDDTASELNSLYFVVRRNEPYYTWEGAIVLDAGDEAYQDFLVEQAGRHVEKLPASSGICIDRMDWLRFYNTRADDGVSYVDKPARSLIVSWKQLMRRLAKVMHDAGKVVYVNNHGKRLDLLEGVDGFFDEFTYASAALNTTALLGLHKPVMGWLSDAKQMTPDPHRFMQRFLYMGAYPMTPFPDNDHSVAPTPEIEGYYLAYAPLFQQLLGKKWVLDCGVLRVEGALANIFETDAGYVIPVVYGESDEARVSLQLYCAGDTARIYHPGPNEIISREIHSCGQGGRREIQAPLKDGCALILLNSVRGTEPVSP